MYHNTTNEQADLLTYQQMTKKQEDIVLEIFKINRKLSPSQCWSEYLQVEGKEHTPLTSIRRAITNLTNAGQLQMTDEKIKGLYGRNEYFWKRFVSPE